MTSSKPSRPFVLQRLERCAVLLRVDQGSVITEGDAVEILRQSFDLTGNRQYVLLFELGRVRSISPGARRVLTAARNILACALVGAEPMDRMLSAPYEQAAYPAEYFTERSTALEWLALMHDILCADPVEHTMSLTVDHDPFQRRRAS
ncbi:hypothetical protein PTW37_07180 [Arthrobacter agilis]|uniref:DUF7793 family protein n=1 Tax=Arthrobacter agilis TaxID=37921 RepID=UPI002365C7A7|nr:hypothetical protein [Arthrobacter agilis]WDF34668.1 hypothetical protein PTW37_07180 [Arthrobacter agilis]